MDYSQIYCAIVFAFIFFILFLKTISKKRKDVKIVETKRNRSESTLSTGNFHEFETLRHLSILQLEKYNAKYWKLTDRYWREIFRRQNQNHHPDHINVSRLQTANILTALDEHLPPGKMHEVTITGYTPKPFRKCEIMRYLRDRIANQNFELVLQPKFEKIRILPILD